MPQASFSNSALEATVSLPSYQVTIGPNVLARVGEIARATVTAHRYAIVTDAHVGPLYIARVVAALAPSQVDVFTIPPGESCKTRATWADLTDRLFAAGFGRDSALIALGGGVVGDISGFVAATYMRGIPIVQLPTTLLAMVDASVGGKTGVDTPFGKNLVGSFHLPAAVIADTSALETLSAPQIRSGLAEVFKHGIIADAAYFDQAIACLPTLLGDRRDLTGDVVKLIARSVEIKAAVVAQDARESGLRKVLNFGHTIGHAIEHLMGYALPHGVCVGIGMALESEIAERLGVAEHGTAGSVRAGLIAAGLPAIRPASVSPESVLEATRIDKKVRAGNVEYALPSRIGAMSGETTGWGIPVPDTLVLDVLRN
ncbi:MAG: 3-dehydroquinate synthase [Gemmatimonadaceae bacterium]